MNSKNCSPTIKSNAINYIANYKINNEIINTNINILNKYLDEDCEFPNNIITKLRQYIIKNSILIDNKIQQIFDQKNAIELNKRYCDICHQFFNNEFELKNHNTTINHLERNNNYLYKQLDTIEFENKKLSGLLNNKKKCYTRLFSEHSKLLIEFNILKQNYHNLEYNIL